jgi:hypothetical protein
MMLSSLTTMIWPTESGKMAIEYCVDYIRGFTDNLIYITQSQTSSNSLGCLLSCLLDSTSLTLGLSGNENSSAF